MLSILLIRYLLCWVEFSSRFCSFWGETLLGFLVVRIKQVEIGILESFYVICAFGGFVLE